MSSIPKGYKKTDVGEIPDDWKAKELKSIGIFSKGRGISRSEVKEQGKPCLRYGEIYTIYDTVIYALKSFISDESVSTSKRLYPGDIIFAASGETSSEIAKNVTYLGEEEAYVGGDTIILTPKSQDSVFLSYLLNSYPIAKQKSKIGQGDAVVHIHISKLDKIIICIPSLTEQQTIAQVLSDMDALIQAQKELIAKKRDIKQGTMQDLLSGRVRLPGYETKGWKHTDIGDIPDDWDVKKLGEEGVFLTTSSYTRSELREYGDVACLHYGDIHTRFHTWLDCSSTELPMISRDMVKQYPYLKNGDLVIADASEDYEGLGDCVEICNIDSRLCIGGLHTIVYRAKPGLFAPSYIGLFRNLQVVRNQLVSQAVGTKVYSLTNSMIGSILVPIPSLLSEQQAIAHVLSDMDDELETLEAELEKLNHMKRGMMQELLTGRIRLI